MCTVLCLGNAHVAALSRRPNRLCCTEVMKSGGCVTSIQGSELVLSQQKSSALIATYSSRTECSRARARNVLISARSVQQAWSWEALKHAKKVKEKFEQLPHQFHQACKQHFW